jgi:uncharacterized membrane protein
MGSTPSRRGNFRRFFLRGLAVVLPATLTLWVLVQAYLWVDSSIAQPINSGVRQLLVETFVHVPMTAEAFGIEPTDDLMKRGREAANLRLDDHAEDARIQREYYVAMTKSWWDSYPPLRLIGLIIAAIAVYLAGRLVGGLLGRVIYRWLERFITSLPVVRKVYLWIKQVVDFLFKGQDGERAIKFSRVVAVQYPRKGIWSVGFQTGTVLKSLSEHAGTEAITVFIPSSPTPFTGYTITVSKTDTVDLPLTVEEAIGFAISGGVLRPDSELTAAQAQPKSNLTVSPKEEDG